MPEFLQVLMILQRAVKAWFPQQALLVLPILFQPQLEQTFQEQNGLTPAASHLTGVLPNALLRSKFSKLGSSVGTEHICNAGDPGLIPASGRSTGEGIGCPIQYSGLENSMDCIVHGVAQRVGHD